MPDAFGYVRVSSEEQADSGLGLEAQRQRIAAYCAMKGLRLADVFADPGQPCCRGLHVNEERESSRLIPMNPARPMYGCAGRQVRSCRSW
jgi:hypothetical protein